MERPGRVLLLLLLGPLLALAAAELAMRLNPAWWRFLASHQPGRATHADGLLHCVRPDDVQIVAIGSSVAARDVDEELLDELLAPRGLKTLNLGIDGAKAFTTAMLVPGILELEPQVVVFVVNPLSLTAGHPFRHPRIYHPRVAWQVLGPGERLKRWRFLAEGGLQWASLLYRYRDRHRDWIAKRWRLREPRHPRDAAGKTGEKLQKSLERNRKRIVSANLDGRGPNVAAMRWMAHDLAEARVHLILLPSPVNPGITGQVMPPARSRLLEQLAAELPCHLVDPVQDWTYPASSFADSLHLNREGREHFTQTVFQAIERVLGD